MRRKLEAEGKAEDDVDVACMSQLREHFKQGTRTRQLMRTREARDQLPDKIHELSIGISGGAWSTTGMRTTL